MFAALDVILCLLLAPFTIAIRDPSEAQAINGARLEGLEKMTLDDTRVTCQRYLDSLFLYQGRLVGSPPLSGG